MLTCAYAFSCLQCRFLAYDWLIWLPSYEVIGASAFLFLSVTRGKTVILHAFNALQELGIMLWFAFLSDLK